MEKSFPDWLSGKKNIKIIISIIITFQDYFPDGNINVKQLDSFSGTFFRKIFIRFRKKNNNYFPENNNYSFLKIIIFVSGKCLFSSGK